MHMTNFLCALVGFGEIAQQKFQNLDLLLGIDTRHLKTDNPLRRVFYCLKQGKRNVKKTADALPI